MTTIVSNLYGRYADGSSRPVRTDAQGALITSPAPVTLIPASAPADVTVLTPLVPWTPYADTAEALVFGMGVDGTAADGATFLIEGSEDGVTPAKSFAVSFALAPGEHEAWATQIPLLVRYWRMSAQPTAAGPTKVAWSVRAVPR